MFSRRAIVFVAILVVAGLLQGLLAGPLAQWPGLSASGYWLIALAAAFLLAAILPAGTSRGAGGAVPRAFLRRSEFLCDTCKYNDARDCSRPERPNATRCPDYRSR